jgi:hypothetical protein
LVVKWTGRGDVNYLGSGCQSAKQSTRAYACR